MTVDTMTGELVPVDKSNAAAVIGYLENARSFLATCVEVTGPEQIALAKAEIATAAEATRQLNLSREIQLDAQEMVRRAEYALGKSIRKGQAEGTIGTRASAAREQRARQRGDITPSLPSSTDIEPDFHANSAKGSSIADLSDGVDDNQFDAALDEAKDEGNLSRANVVRKTRNQKPSGQSRKQRGDAIADLAEQGYSSRQISQRLGVTDETVRDIARDFDIDVHADKVIGKTRRHDSNRIVEQIVIGLEGTCSSIGLIDYDDIDREQAEQWASSLDDSFRVLNRFRKQIKEMTHG